MLLMKSRIDLRTQRVSATKDLKPDFKDTPIMSPHSERILSQDALDEIPDRFEDSKSLCRKRSEARFQGYTDHVTLFCYNLDACLKKRVMPRDVS